MRRTLECVDCHIKIGIARLVYHPKRRAARPKDWGIGMTVCIAAIASIGGISSDESALVLITDKMVGVGVTTADLPLVIKGVRFCEHWFVLYSGNDIARVPPILRKVRAVLAMENAPTVTQVTRAFVQVYQEERQQLAEQVILNPIGLTMNSFADMLATNDTAELADLRRKIQDLEFDVEFLIGGFDPDGQPHIFTVTQPGVEDHYDSIGFWSIGSGAKTALSSLLYRGFNPLMSLPEAVYYAAEAKFMAETSLGVGRDCFFLVMKPDQHVILIQDDVDKLRDIWDKEGRPPVPANLDQRVEPCLGFQLTMPLVSQT